ncbi:CynX/NimT family MFS transporter [Oceanobacillus jeddahense]|uniref:MFS transporter n=1 Tax=Oceanobacillus jeddahense TaxID=1462527 RepID=A0ABY5JN80_9BACI|nr:MFS transporter [Oceanobacillus jeddahense]UUI01757.1 MFS transporter [Oceanobacillus jeddahense]
MKEYTLEKQELGKDDTNVLIIIGIFLVALNLRPALTSIGPIMGIIRDEIGFANWNVALLTSLPLVAFAVMSIISSYLAQKYSNEKTLIFGLIILSMGIIFRSSTMIILLFLGTLLIGIGIAVCNVLLPGIIKDKFPDKLSIMTGLYSSIMGISATVASAISVPIAKNMGLGWRNALLIWVVPAILASFYWLVIIRRKPTHRIQERSIEKTKKFLRSPFAWFIAFFMGCHSLLFYITISWFPEILIHFGANKTIAGFLLSYLQLVGIASSLLIPLIAGKLKSQVGLVISLNILLIIGVIYLLLYHNDISFIISTTLIGVSLSGNFTIALLLLSIRTKNTKQATLLSGMAQSTGYALAALGPIAVGFIYDITRDWTIPLFLLILLAICSSLLGLKVGQNKFV